MDNAPVPEPQTHEERMEQMLGDISAMLHRMEHRDRARLAWGTFRTILSIAPFVIFVWGAWYFATHSVEIIQQVTEQTMQHMLGGGSASSTSSQSFMQQLQEYLK